LQVAFAAPPLPPPFSGVVTFAEAAASCTHPLNALRFSLPGARQKRGPELFKEPGGDGLARAEQMLEEIAKLGV